MSGQSSLAADGRGRLYVATSDGLYIGEPGSRGYKFHRYENPKQITDRSAYGVYIDPAGMVWFGCGDRLCRLGTKGVEVFGSEAGVLPDHWDAILTDNAGNLWIRSLRRLLVRPRGARSFIATSHRLAHAGLSASLYLDRDGRLFVPTESGLRRLTAGRWETVGIDQGLPVNPTCCVLQDREGSIWVGLAGAGLTRWLGYEQWESWTRSEGLAGSNLQATIATALAFSGSVRKTGCNESERTAESRGRGPRETAWQVPRSAPLLRLPAVHFGLAAPRAESRGSIPEVAVFCVTG